MNWKKEAENDLREYQTLIIAMKNIVTVTKSIESKMISLKGSATDSSPIQGGRSHYEDNIINCIAEKERLKFNYFAAKFKRKAIERSLEALSERERRILEVFYINRIRDPVEILSEELCLEKSRIYQLRDEALKRFTKNMYGVTET